MGVSTGRGIHRIYAEYSWGIHGIYVCIGYVSGMYRVCIGNMLKATGREEYGEGGVNTFILRIKNINFSDKCSQMTSTANSLARNLHTTLWQRKMASNLQRDCCHQT